MANWLDESAEAELVQGLRHRDPAAAEVLEHLFSARLKALARSWDLQETDAYSVALEALMKVVRGIDSFAPRPGATFRSWVLKIMLNCLKDFVKRRKLQREREVSSDALADAETVDEAEATDQELPRQRVALASPASEEPASVLSHTAVVTTALLERMSPRERAVMMRTANGMADRDIAAELRISPTAVRVARLRARARANNSLAEIAPTLDETIQRKLRKLLA